MASVIFLDVILISLTPSGIIRNVQMLQGTIMENSAKSPQILKIPKANTIYLISGIISRVTLTSWTHQEAQVGSKAFKNEFELGKSLRNFVELWMQIERMFE